MRLESAGYSVGGNDWNYRADIQTAESKVAASQAASLVASAVGGTSESGSSASSATLKHAVKPVCTGTVDSCDTHFGN